MAVAVASQVCPSCGDEFDDPSGRRIYCLSCSPRRSARVSLREPLDLVPLERSFARFVEWIDEMELTLDGGEAFVLEPFQEEIAFDVIEAPPLQETWVLIPQGNAKTTLMAAVALFLLESTPSPWIPIGAATRDQAEIMFAQAAGFVERSSRAGHRFVVQPGNRRIKCQRTGGMGMKVYAADVKGGDGPIPTDAFVDELHRHDDLRLYRLWKGKLKKRSGRLHTMSTAGEPGSPFEDLRERIRSEADERERDGAHLRAVGRNLVYHEWMVPSADVARDLELVKAANPLAQIDVSYLRDYLESLTLDYGQDWLRLTCNIPARSEYAAIPEPDWDGQQTDQRIPPGVPVAVGADFAWLLDTTAIVPLWVRDPEFRLFGDPVILTPPRDGTMLSPDDVKAAFLGIHEANPIEVVVMDVHRAEDIAGWLADDVGVTVIPRAQSAGFAVEDYERFMEGLRKRRLFHTGHREFRRHVLNAVARRLPGGDTRFERPSSSRNVKRQNRRVIDALTAASMVHAWSFTTPSEPPPSPRFVDLAEV